MATVNIGLGMKNESPTLKQTAEAASLEWYLTVAILFSTYVL